MRETPCPSYLVIFIGGGSHYMLDVKQGIALVIATPHQKAFLSALLTKLLR